MSFLSWPSSEIKTLNRLRKRHLPFLHPGSNLSLCQKHHIPGEEGEEEGHDGIWSFVDIMCGVTSGSKEKKSVASL